MTSERMIRDQIQARGIRDVRVLDAMRDIDRSLFVPPEYRALSYADRPLPIGEGQTISQPYIVALMTELLHIQPTHRILEIGTGSGYQAAVLSRLCREVYTMEILEPLFQAARDIFRQLNLRNICAVHGDGSAGLPDHAPYNGIIVTCAPVGIPAALQTQLADGGRLVIPVGAFMQELKVLKKKGDRITETVEAPVRFVPMTGAAGDPGVEH